jgi:peptide/nickel transport system substrate-binding protein
MVNALAAGEIMAEFRGHLRQTATASSSSSATRQVVQESPWVCSLVVTFNTKKKPFDDQRGAQGAFARDRPLGRRAGAAESRAGAPCRRLLRPGYEFALPEAELVKMPGFAKDINASRAEAKKLLADAGQSNLTFTLTNRNVAMPYTPSACS